MALRQAPQAIVFADICQSTRLFEVHGDVQARSIVSHALAILTDRVTDCGGVIIKTIGDEVMATFPDLMDAVEATSKMHPAIRSDRLLADVGLAIKIGLNFGDVLLEDGDVYGDAVNVAARMTRLAKPHQILTTATTIQRLPPVLQSHTRSLGPMRIRGKKEVVEIVEYLWQWDRRDLTAIGSSFQPFRQATRTTLMLRYGEEAVTLQQSHPAFSIGRGEENSLVVGNSEASRTHAHIEFRNRDFVLVDHSTNGTILQTESGESIFVHRDHIRLRGEGLIMLGKKLSRTAEGVIHYKSVSSG